MKSYRYILLDWVGNLAKTLHVWLDSTTSVLKKYGHRHTDAEVIDGLSDLHGLMQHLGVIDIDKIVDAIKVKVQILLPDVELYPDALYVLEALKSKGKKLALITSSNRHLVTDTLIKYKLDSVFDAVVAREDVRHPKPNPEPLETGLSRLSGTKDHSIMIGDSEMDLSAAGNAGIDSILFYPPEHAQFYNLEKLKAYNPTFIVSDFRKVLDIVQ